MIVRRVTNLALSSLGFVSKAVTNPRRAVNDASSAFLSEVILRADVLLHRLYGDEKQARDATTKLAARRSRFTHTRFKNY